MSCHAKQIFLLSLVIGILMRCSSNDAQKADHSHPPADTVPAVGFYFFLSADTFLDSGYDVLAMFEERDDIPVLPVKDSHRIFKEQAALFIDARNPEEYDAGHIPGAVNIPYDQITLPPYSKMISRLDKNGRIVVYCNTHICSVSHTCAEDLKCLGFKRVIIAEGYMQWVEKGYSVEKFQPLG